MKKQVIFSILANLIPVGFSWLILLYLVHFGTKQHIGYWGLIQAIALPIHLFFTFKLRVVQLVEYENYKETSFFYSRVILAFSSIFFTVLYSIFFLDYEYLYSIFFLALSYGFIIIREYYVSIYQINQKNEYFFLSSFLSSFLSFFGFILFYHYTNDISLSVIVFSILKIFSLILDVFFNKCSDYLNLNKIKKNEIISILKKGMPLGITVVMTSLVIIVPQLLIEDELGLESLGIFISLTSLLSMFGLFFNSIFQVFLPKLSRLDVISRVKELKTIAYYMVLGLVVFDFVFYIFFDDIYFIIMGDRFLVYASEMKWCILAANFSVLFSFGNFLLNLLGLFNVQSYLYGFVTLIVFLLNYIYLIDFGLIVSIISIIVANFLGFILCLIVYFRKFYLLTK